MVEGSPTVGRSTHQGTYSCSSSVEFAFEGGSVTFAVGLSVVDGTVTVVVGVVFEMISVGIGCTVELPLK